MKYYKQDLAILKNSWKASGNITRTEDTEPLEEAWYENRKICMLMSDNKEIRFPAELNKKLKNATDQQRNNIEIICDGTGLHWPDLDEDLSVTGIIRDN